MRTTPLLQPRTRLSTIAIGLALAVPAIMVSMPWWADAGTIRSVIELSCYVVLAQMWNLLAGYAGLVSVGQQAFLGVSAYAMFMLSNNFGVNPFLAVPLSLVTPVLLAIPSYLLLRRLEGPYFAIGTWVIAEICRLLVANSEYLGSSSGIALRSIREFSALTRQIAGLSLAAGMLAFGVGGMYLLLRSRYGLALAAIRDNPISAASQGVDVPRVKFLVFLAAAVGCGLVGAVYYLSMLRISPGATFDINWTSIAVFSVMIGGIGTIEGPLLGALLYFALDRWFSEFGAVYMIALGAGTLAVALFARDGIWGALTRRFPIELFPIRRVLHACEEIR